MSFLPIVIYCSDESIKQKAQSVIKANGEPNTMW